MTSTIMHHAPLAGRRTMRHPGVVLLFCAVALAASTRLTAQCGDELRLPERRSEYAGIEVEQRQRVGTAQPPEGSPPRRPEPVMQVVGGFLFTAHYGDASVAFTLMGARVTSVGSPWIDGNAAASACIRWNGWNAAAPERPVSVQALRDSMRSVPLTLAVGDTISFVRSMAWTAPQTERGYVDDYLASENLDLVVELARSPEGTRLALLDSIGAAAQPAPGSPLMHCALPFDATVRFVVPPVLVGARAELRAHVHAAGAAAEYTRGVVVRRIDPFEPSPTIWLRSLGPNDLAGIDPDDPRLEVTSAPRALRIELGAGLAGERVAVAVYDSAGAYLYTPIFTLSASGLDGARFRCPADGMYTVVLYVGMAPAAVRRVRVGRE